MNGVTMLVLFSTFACKSHGVELKDIMKCLERLTPCRPFLKSPRLPRTCCDPLKKVLIDDPTCVCAVYNNDSILKSFNMTKAQAYQLPIKCGMPPPDPNRCKTVNGNAKCYTNKMLWYNWTYRNYCSFTGTGASGIVVKFKEKHNEGNVVVFNFMGVAVVLCSTFLLLLWWVSTLPLFGTEVNLDLWISNFWIFSILLHSSPD